MYFCFLSMFIFKFFSSNSTCSWADWLFSMLWCLNCLLKMLPLVSSYSWIILKLPSIFWRVSSLFFSWSSLIMSLVCWKTMNWFISLSSPNGSSEFSVPVLIPAMSSLLGRFSNCYCSCFFSLIWSYKFLRTLECCSNFLISSLSLMKAMGRVCLTRASYCSRGFLSTTYFFLRANF